MTRRIDIDRETGQLLLKFPYDEQLNSRVKQLPGCRWNPQFDAWVLSFEHVERTFDLLLDRQFKVTRSLREYCREHARPVDEITSSGGEGDEEGPYLPVPPETLSITDLNHRAKAAIDETFDDGLWLVGELQGYDRNQSYQHAFFELVERPEEEADPVARIQAVLFEGHRSTLRQTLRQAPEELELRDGLAVRVKGDVDLYPPKGNFQFVVRDIDPAYTAGRLQRRRRAILKHLEAEGILEDNLEIDWPLCPLRIGLITSHESDAYNDFRDELEQSAFGFQLTVHDANVQGERTEPSVLRALEYFREHAEAYDVVAIVRGGGARSDLAYFDTEAIGEAVCRHPVKIVCGIGHQRDVSLLDHVADSQKTPTAAARCLVRRIEDYRTRVDECRREIMDRALDRLRSTEERLQRLSVQVQHRTERRVNAESSRLDGLRSKLAHGVQRRLEVARRRLEGDEQQLERAADGYLERRRQPLREARRQLRPERLRRRLDRRRSTLERLRDTLERRLERTIAGERRRLEQLAERLELLDPARVLERGFALVRRDGEVVRTAESVRAGERLEVQLADGRIDVKVEGRADDSDSD